MDVANDVRHTSLPTPALQEKHEVAETSKENPPAISEAEATIKFEIPDDCRVFSPFPRLPPEIRQQIWEATLATPGMHFLKLSTVNFGIQWWTAHPPVSNNHVTDEDGDDNGVDAVVKREGGHQNSCGASLRALYPTPEADISYYTTMNKELTKLSVVCPETATLVGKMASGPKALSLDGGRLVSLDTKSDVFYLEYAPPSIFERGFDLSSAIDCPQLSHIRNVAVRFCHGWYEQRSPRRCATCGSFHDVSDGVKYPAHLYQFLARYLPNLENFYFVDYLILRKPQGTVEPDSKVAQSAMAIPEAERKSTFTGGNRTYFEADPENWDVKSRVFEMKTWLQDHFLKYTRASRLSNHKNPGNVRFSVLACEWSVGKEVEEKKIVASPVKKGRNKRVFCGEHATRWRSQLSATPPPTVPTTTSKPHDSGATAEESKGSFYVFGSDDKIVFPFTFSMSPR